MRTYSIIDLETTGFGKYDRIVEIGIVKVDAIGRIIDTYSTLINPDRDVSATHIHGITATMVKDAPKFVEVYPFIIKFLNGTVPVSHNRTFDFNFFKREVISQGITDYTLEGLCTLQLSRSIFPELPCRKLSSLCEYFDIELLNHHSALDDCFATSKVLTVLLSENTVELDCCEHDYPLADLSVERVEHNRDKSFELQKEELNKLSRVIRSQPDFSGNSDYNVAEYLNLLDRILEDRIITDEEADQVRKYAAEYKIPASAVFKIHEEYYRRLCDHYLEDEIISESEALDLNLVCQLLGLDKLTSQVILDLEKGRERSAKKKKHNQYLGKSVCFTGALIGKIDGRPVDRNLAHKLAIESGLVIKKGVSGKLDILVVADPNTNSGKAKKARELSIPIIAEMVFWSKIGIAAE